MNYLTSVFIAVICTLILTQTSTAAESSFNVKSELIPDEKSVFATVESLDTIPARSRLSGTVAEMKVSEGDSVNRGQVIALISDDKNALRIRSVNAQIASARAEKNNADTELKRARDLFDRGIFPKTRLDAAQTRADIANNQIKTLTANRNLVSQQVREGQVLAPSAGRILSVPVTAGTVVMPGETIAMIAAENYVLKLQLPERHARYMKMGAKVRVDNSLVDGGNSTIGKIIRVYPQIRDGRVIADAQVDGLGNYFVGERVRVWVPTESRSVILVPELYITTRYGLDFLWVTNETGETTQVLVQRGRQIGDEVEILSGLSEGDQLNLQGPLPVDASLKKGAH